MPITAYARYIEDTREILIIFPFKWKTKKLSTNKNVKKMEHF